MYLCIFKVQLSKSNKHQKFKQLNIKIMKKKSILCSILLLCMMLLGTMGFAQTIVFSEDFSGFTNPDYGENISSSLDDYTSWTGWNGSYVYCCSGITKVGKSSAKGWLQTPTIDLSGNDGNFTLEFDAAAWLGDSSCFWVYLDNTSYLVTGLNNVANSSDNYDANNIVLDHFTLPLSGGTSSSHIRFEGRQNAKTRFFLDNVVITQNGGTPTAAQPAFSHESGTYTSPFDLTITSTTENASIYYTLDGSTPSTSSNLYASPINISQTTTVKAIAAADGYNNSLVASATYTFPETVDNIAEFKALSNGSQYHVIDNDVTFVFNHGAYTYVKDASAALLVYGGSYFSNMTEGDQISNLTGKHAVYFGQVEMKEALQPAAPTSTIGTMTPMVITVNDILTNYDMYDAQLVTLENVLFPDGFDGSSNTATIVQNGDTMQLYNQFGIDTVLEANTTTNLTGFVAIHNSQKQIYPRYNQDFGGQEVVPTPSLSITAPVNGSIFSTLDTLPIGLNYQNFVLGTDGYIKVESPLLTLVGLDNPLYMTEELYEMMSTFAFSPLPAGTHTITCSLVDMDLAALDPAVNATTTFTVVAPEQSTPVITAAGDEAEGDNTFYFNATISITADAGASIYYTTDGNEPTEASTLYSTPFQVTTTSTIKAIAVKPNYQNSNVSTLEVTITAPTVETPIFTPGTGTYADSVTFTLACATDNSEIRYTMDGTEPTETSTLYTAPVTLTATTTVKAKAFKTTWLASETATSVYTVVYDPVLTVNTPALNFTSTQLSQEFTVSGAHLDEAITLTCNNTHFTVTPATITTPNSNTVVTVTFDGSEPATGIITIVSDTLSAQVSLTATAQLPAPEFTADITDTMVTVAISCTVADAAIHYTIDGTEPTAESDTYTEPIVFSTPGSYTVKSMATKATWENSTVAISDTYIINEPPAPQPIDTIIYSVGFEAEEGFEAGSYYQNTDISFTGPEGAQWGTFYGTPSTNNHITGAQSMQMRWYTAEAHSMNVGYTYTHFDLRNVTHVTFLANSSNGLNVKVSHSIDGGNTYSDGEVFSLSSTAHAFDYVVDENGSNDFVRLRFAIVLPDPLPTPNNSRLVIDSVVVYGIPGLAPTMVSIPTITPNSGFFYDPQTVSITCETEDAVIRYTTDGSEPTETSTIYAEPFQVSTTTTIKAKAWKTDLTPSFTAIANISFPAEVDNIAAFKDAASNEPQQIMSDVTFVFRSGRYIFVEDNSAAMLIFDNSPATITSTYNEGDVIHSGIFGRYTTYNGMVEMVPTYNAAEATGTPVTVTPAVATVANIKSQYNDVYESKLVRLNDVLFLNDTLFVQNGDTMSIRNRFNTLTTTINAGDQADVTGFVSFSTRNGYQIFPRGDEDINIYPVIVMDTVATPEFFFQRDGEFYRMTITCETEGASIYYTIDGNDPDESSYEYTDAVPFYLNVHYIIKAIAMKEGMNNSAVASYDYNPVGINQFELRDNLVVYPNPAVSNVVISAKDGDLSIERVELYNIYGQLLNTTTVNGSRAEISVSSIATGTYFAKVFTDKGITTMPIIRK